MCSLYANTTPFYVRKSSIWRFWYLQGVGRGLVVGEGIVGVGGQSWSQPPWIQRGTVFNCFLFFFFNFYLFIYYFWLCWVFVSVRGLSLVAASGGHSSSWCAGLSLSWPLLLRSTGSRRAGSVVVAHGSSCSVACGIFPDQGSNPCPLHSQADSQPLRHQGSPVSLFYSRNSTVIQGMVGSLHCNTLAFMMSHHRWSIWHNHMCKANEWSLLL